jgi:DNA repair protein RadD
MTLRWYQQEAIDSIFAYFTVARGNPVIALPTGTGKSHVIGGFVQRALQHYPTTRVMCLTHVKELIEQNAAKLLEMWPHAPLGIYSAGLSRRDTMMPIIFGGCKSVVNSIDSFPTPDLLFIDECHLLSPKAETTYQKIITTFRAQNQYLKVIGLSATPFRPGVGMITKGGVFTDVCYNMCDMKGFDRLLAEGWLSPPIPKRTKTTLDVSNVGMQNGEFVQAQLQAAVDKYEITHAALQEAYAIGYNRRSWLAFASGVEHAEHISEILNSFGISSAAVHSKITKEQRNERISAFKRGELRCLSNNNVLTTGFDHPPIDFIPMLRPTMSPGLWVQMIGRGTRPSERKANCLVADFASNTRRLGPINDPIIPQPKGKTSGEVPVKICDACDMYNHARVRFCAFCGNEFQFKVNITKTAGTEELLKSDFPQTEYFNVDKVMYTSHEKKANGSQSIRVAYFCGLQQFNEWLSFEAIGFWRKKSREWWRQRYVKLPQEIIAEPPDTNAAALQKISQLRAPRRIRVWVNKSLPEVLDAEF